MSALTANFATGTNGNAIATSDTGSASAWDAVVIGGGSASYDNTHTTHASLAGKLVNPSGAKTYLGWTSSGKLGGTVADMYGRFYLYLTANPASFLGIAGANTAAAYNGTTVFNLLVTSAGKILTGGASAGLGTTTNTITLNQWVRVEFHVVGNASTGSVEVKLFNSADSSTATETGTYTGANTGGAIGAIAFGCGDSIDTTGGTFWLANCVGNATAYPGPFPVNSVAPAVSGSASSGSVLTCDGGTWNGTFTLGYQWTSNGTNIVGATSSTYTTQVGDVGNAIGCTVTATGQQATNESAAKASSNTITVTSGGGGGGSSTLALASHPARFLRQKGIR